MITKIWRTVRLGSVLTFALVATGWAVPAQAQVRLEVKHTEGSKQVLHTNMKIKQTLTLAGMNIDTESDRFIISSMQVGKKDADGKLRAEVKIDKLSVNLKLPGGITMTFDSDDPNRKADNPQLEPVLELMRAATKVRTTLVFDSSGKVVAVEGLDKAAEGLAEELKGEFDAEQVKKTANQLAERLPTDPVKPGDTWTRNSDLPLGSGQVMSFTTEYKYVGEVKEGTKTLDKVEAKATSVSFTIAETSKLPLKVTKSDLKPTESTETLLFDRAAGQWHLVKEKIRIQGDLDFTLNGQALPGKLDLTIESDTSRQP